jgi:hypothetical protein
MKTLAEKYPEAIERFESVGLDSIAALCHRHYRQVDMERQLGTSSSVSKWLTGEHLPSRSMEERAQKVLSECSAAVAQDCVAPAPAAPEENVLMVVCPTGSTAKVQRVLAMLGCEVEVI